MIFKEDPSTVATFLTDTSNLKTGRSPGVYLPESAAEAAELLRSSSGSGRRFTIAGNGTGTTGGRIPEGDWVIAMHRLQHIGDPVPLSAEEGSICVEAGAVLGDIQRKVEDAGWFYPPDPTESLCFIGSTIANNSSGSRTFMYGPTREHVRRILVALPQGDLLDIPRGRYLADENGFFRLELPVAGSLMFRRPIYRMPETSKHNAGYYSKEGMDLIDLFIGSEGTLGIVLEADLKLVPLPRHLFACLVYFSAVDDLFAFTESARSQQNGVRPRVLEFFDANSLGFLRQEYPDIPTDAAGAIFFEQETSPDREENDLQAWLDLMESSDAMVERTWIAFDREEQRRLTAFRHALPLLVNEWLSRQQESKISTDMAVPAASFRELYDFYDSSCRKNNFTYIIFGHIGDAHVHLNILPRNREEFLLAKQLYLAFVEKVLALGGTLSAEHGIGKLKSGYLAAMYGESGIMEMARVKKMFDPELTLNIGNLIPASYLVQPENT
ncbi:MAG: FAD-binding oxidoreductase [Chlorobium sp.]|uniref:FAD-binding oxidoreductase n=1 Tax=Chlorobium sp. TaxID=1095 RepID=UPI0025C17E6E|nr:FAD-binding oxidoreductase [Chlorobium sp.]MCF8216129.1 FAD-binding oxidoreductase [Chlorobium sp.]MCF8271090.1 FAD-binding oxidoreductase [Chlorobium sp.]MCF8287404.1 FAD-binding oxidoreductase [Chlorobium sp.]MCF8291003.1 FAD-binding oxidoreductase [Chlorobium sp.]MCF8385098.1 FAD-binding oxidoreductase [Chlorobium sp.]